MNTVTVTLVHTPRPENWPDGSRWQPWRWVARTSNGERIANGGEAYTNVGDAVEAVTTLMSAVVPANLTIVHGDDVTTRPLRDRSDTARLRQLANELAWAADTFDHTAWTASDAREQAELLNQQGLDR